jgi:hypothetical protein
MSPRAPTNTARNRCYIAFFFRFCRAHAAAYRGATMFIEIKIAKFLSYHRTHELIPCLLQENIIFILASDMIAHFFIRTIVRADLAGGLRAVAAWVEPHGVVLAGRI